MTLIGKFAFLLPMGQLDYRVRRRMILNKGLMTIRLEAIAIKDFAPFTAQKTVFGAAKGADGRAADVHIFVGENGTGKTRLLSLLMAACGNIGELKDRCPGKMQAMVVARADDITFVWGPNNAIYKVPSA